MNNILIFIKRFLRYILSWFTIRPKEFVRLIKDKSLYQHKSYFPEAKWHKSPVKVFMEQIGTIIRYSKVNDYYFSYGFDVKTKSEESIYLNYWYFRDRRQYLNTLHVSPCTCLLRNKLLFGIYASGIGVSNGNILFYTTDHHIYDFQTKSRCTIQQVVKALDNSPIFCKIVDGECGIGIFKLHIEDGKIKMNEDIINVEDLERILIANQYILQSLIIQHKKMALLHPQSTNTIRMVTVRSLKDKHIHVFPSILRIGTGKSVVDNTSQGGICVGINLETGYLKEYGFYKPQFGTKTLEHPDSHIKFSDFQIPFFEQAKQQAIYFHSMLPGMHSIGWDIAIGEDGPIFIEGNDNWEINGPQICNGGQMALFKEYFYE